jgi:hypothetical protein
VSLWLSAAADKEAQLPRGQLDPLHGRDDPSAMFMLMASSPKYVQHVIDRALDDLNTPVALAALKALVRTAGTKSLVEITADGAQPAVEAMVYPDREVQFFAAVSLANADPQKRYEGCELVMQVLKGAIRQSGRKIALLIAADIKQRNTLKDSLRQLGYEVVEASDAEKGMAAGREYSGVDMAVLGVRPAPAEAVRAFRSNPAFIALPVVVANRTPELRTLARQDKRVILTDTEPATTDLDAALKAASEQSVGRPLTPEQATRWSVTASNAIRDLGLRRNPVYDISRAENALIEALEDTRGEVRVAAADALAVIPGAKAQRAVAALANKVAVDSDVRVRAYEALAASVRRFGAQLAEVHLKRVRETAADKTASQAVREAAARAYGALNLPSEEIIPLIDSLSPEY